MLTTEGVYNKVRDEGENEDERSNKKTVNLDFYAQYKVSRKTQYLVKI